MVAYNENPNITTKDQLLYMINKGVNNNVYPNEGYLASTYLGVQVATAAAKYLSFHSDTYGVNSNEFYLMGQSYGAFMSMNLGLGQTSDYINTDGTLKKPFNKLGDRDRFLNNMMRAATFTIKGISLWSISYPIISNKNYNPYGNLISPNDPRVIHFHGLMDTEVSYKTDWLNFTPDTSLYCAGPTDVREFFSVSQVPFKAFINCKGGHAVFDSPSSAIMITIGKPIKPMYIFGKPNTLACHVFITVAQLSTRLNEQLKIASGCLSRWNSSTASVKLAIKPVTPNASNTPNIHLFD